MCTRSIIAAVLPITANLLLDRTGTKWGRSSMPPLSTSVAVVDRYLFCSVTVWISIPWIDSDPTDLHSVWGTASRSLTIRARGERRDSAAEGRAGRR